MFLFYLRIIIHICPTLVYVLVALVEDRVGTTMRCHTISLACVESSAAGLGSWSGIVSSE